MTAHQPEEQANAKYRARGQSIADNPDFQAISSRGGMRSAEVRRERRRRLQEAKDAAELIMEIRPPLKELVQSGLVDYIKAAEIREAAKDARRARPKNSG